MGLDTLLRNLQSSLLTPRLLLCLLIILMSLMGALSIGLSGSMDYGEAVIHLSLCLLIPLMLVVSKCTKELKLASRLLCYYHLVHLLSLCLLSSASLISLLLLMTVKRAAKSFLWSLATLLAFISLILMATETAIAALDFRQKINLEKMQRVEVANNVVST